MITTIEELALSALRRDEVTLEARVRSLQKCQNGEKLSVQLSFEGHILNATCQPSSLGTAGYENAQKLTPQSLVRVSGQSQSLAIDLETNGNDSPALVVRVTRMIVVSKAFPGLPEFQGGQLSGSLQERLDNRVLEQRAAASGAMFKLYSGMTQLIVEFLTANEFVWLQTPRLRGSHVAGDNEYFHVPYFGRDAWLCQHTQHSLQGAISMDMKRVFDIGPVFRQEAKSDVSARHMSEFTLLGVNMVYENDWHEVVDLLGAMLVFVLKGLQKRKQYANLLETVRRYYPASSPFKVGLDENGKVPRITFMEAKQILREKLGYTATEDTVNFTPEEEASLGKYFRDEHPYQTDLFTIEHFPLAMRQFNSHTVKGAPYLSETWDFIGGGREICSGSHRVSDYDELRAAMLSGSTGPAMDPESPEWRGWASSFKVGMPPHAGASFGVNRILQGFLGLDEIRETTLFPRDANRLAP